MVRKGAIMRKTKRKSKKRKGKYHHLNVSTQGGVVDTAVIAGTWTLNEIILRHGYKLNSGGNRCNFFGWNVKECLLIKDL